MRFKKQARYSDRRSRAGKHGSHGGVTAGGVTETPGFLHGVSAVKYHGTAGLVLHHFKPAHVHHQIAVAERVAALGKQNFFIAGAVRFFHDVDGIPRRQKLSLFYIHRAACGGAGENKVGLAAQECRNLQHVGYFGGGFGLRGFVHIYHYRQAEFAFHRAQYAQAFLKPRSTIGAD